jgi:hypothetical protein
LPKYFKTEITMEKKQLTNSWESLLETTRTPLRSDRDAPSCLYLDGRIPFSGYSVRARGRRDTAIPIQPESGLLPGTGGLPAWRGGSLRDPEKQIRITNRIE